MGRVCILQVLSPSSDHDPKACKKLCQLVVDWGIAISSMGFSVMTQGSTHRHRAKGGHYSLTDQALFWEDPRC